MPDFWEGMSQGFGQGVGLGVRAADKAEDARRWEESNKLAQEQNKRQAERHQWEQTAQDWDQGMRKMGQGLTLFNQGDVDQGLTLMSDAYNTHIPDGQKVQLSVGQDEQGNQVIQKNVHDMDGNQVVAKSWKPQEFVGYAMENFQAMADPKSYFKYMHDKRASWQEKNAEWAASPQQMYDREGNPAAQVVKQIDLDDKLHPKVTFKAPDGKVFTNEDFAGQGWYSADQLKGGLTVKKELKDIEKADATIRHLDRSTSLMGAPSYAQTQFMDDDGNVQIGAFNSKTGGITPTGMASVKGEDMARKEDQAAARAISQELNMLGKQLGVSSSFQPTGDPMGDIVGMMTAGKGSLDEAVAKKGTPEQQERYAALKQTTQTINDRLISRSNRRAGAPAGGLKAPQASAPAAPPSAPQAAPQSSAPYQEGQMIRSKRDGKTYVIRGGQPVPVE